VQMAIGILAAGIAALLLLSLVTGLDPRHHAAVFWNQGIGPVATLAEHLQRAGYVTRGVNTNVFLKELAGLEVPLNLDGRSLVPLLRGEAEAPRGILYALEPLSNRKGRTGVAWSARDGRLKWIRIDGTKPSGGTTWPGECYDLLADPGERRNLANLGPGPCAELASATERWRARGLDGRCRAPGRCPHRREAPRTRLSALTRSSQLASRDEHDRGRWHDPTRRV